MNTAVYQVEAGGRPYFLKVRGGDFLAASVMLPHFLHEQGLKQVIPPLPTQTGQLWATLDRYAFILYPFVAGQNAFERSLTAPQRVELGRAMREFHDARIPSTIANELPQERFAPHWRTRVHALIKEGSLRKPHDPLVAELAAFLQSERARLLQLLRRAEALAAQLQANTPDFIVCHGDIHGWNLLLDEQGALYLVDWDTLTYAPKERDLMFVGCGLGGRGQSLTEETQLFYQGYGEAQVNQVALAYYRYERIIEDVGLFCEQLLNLDEAEEERQQALIYLQRNFLPSDTVDLAFQLDQKG